MKYFFILGKNPTLSVAEISAVFRADERESAFAGGKLIGENVFILETKKEIDANELIEKLGGTIKIGAVNDEVESNNDKELFAKAIKSVKANKAGGKFKFGVSYYGKSKFNAKSLAMEIKKHLRKKSVNCRWVTSRESALSSVVVGQNKLVGKGAEIVLIKQGDRMLIGRTLAVQPFKEWSFRDYGRPARDDRSGMIPPKLARIMINLARVRRSEILLDPFCGSGTILTEALLMGHDNVIGTDISEKAARDTKKNIAWTERGFEIKDSRFKIFNKSATELSQFIKPNSVGAIVTEPYLGPQRGRIDFKKTIKELEDLYGKSLAEFKKVLKPGGRAVMVWPAYAKATADKPAFAKDTADRPAYDAEATADRPILKFITPSLNGFKIVNPISPDLRENNIIKLTDRNTIIYGRKGQKVWREIMVLEFK